MSEQTSPTRPTIPILAGGVGGLAVGALIVWLICLNTTPMTSDSYPTRRPGIHTKADEEIRPCTAAFVPKRLYVINLTPQATPSLNLNDLRPLITYVNLDTNGDPIPPVMTYVQSPTATTPLDLNLDLGGPTSGKPGAVLIKIVNSDPTNTLFGDNYTVISIDSNKDMFCKKSYTTKEALIGVTYKAPPSGQTKLAGSFGIGVIVKQPTLPDKLPIWVDPEIENNGFN
jgi:hypothetical protein